MEDYFIGIDIGTNSIGYAVTDTNYNLLKKSSKSMWGIRLFEESKTAKERRIFRVERRRLKRRAERIKLLQSLFSEEIVKIDPSFFIRLQESKYHKEDRQSGEDYSNILFNDINFNDKNYYKLYPTISHLKKKLIQTDEKQDIRLIYLALHNIIKNRGHFLFEDLGDEKPNFEYTFNKLNFLLQDIFGFSFNVDNNLLGELIKNKNGKILENELKILFNIKTKKGKEIEIIKALSNNSFKLYNIFEDENLKEIKAFKISEFTDEKIEELCLDEKVTEFLLLLKSISDWKILENILKDNKYLCFSKVEIFEKHKRDLKVLKEVIKKYLPKEYNSLFKEIVKDNYCAYIGLNKVSNKKVYVKKCTQEDFYSNIKKIISKINEEDKNINYILEEIKKGTFLPKQVNEDNNVIPYQIHLAELKKIIENASVHYEFFNNIDDDGISIKEKIISIFKFKIPYYVGPLNSHSPYSWFVKNNNVENQKILPWNFNKIVDLEKSGENFIKKMTNKCTYLPKEDVLPKNSLIYSEFMVLNEINNLKINGKSISIKAKKAIFENLFKTRKKVTLKAIKSYFIYENYMQKEDVLSGVDIEIKSSFATYLDFKDMIEKYNDLNMIEDIIVAIVIFGDDKKILKSRIKKKYKHILSESEIKKCLSFNYSGWGRLSKKLLTEITDVNKETGELVSILDMLRETNQNFMELLSKKYSYINKIDEENSLIEKDKSLLQIVENLHLSPMVKRPIYQSLLIVKEIIKINKCEPKKIFIEVAREKQKDSKRASTRKNTLIAAYKGIEKEYEELYKEIENTDNTEFNKLKLYLYYQQLGRCMYTGKKIDLSNLMNVNVYDKDHIYPKSKLKDDSLDNLVLVDKKANARKSDNYPLGDNIQEDMKGFWFLLKQKGLISDEKYKRLIRNTELTYEELNAFINRQLVETRQSTKEVARILKEIYPNTEIVYTKASLVSDFRDNKNFKFVKVREVNDYHHAKDAYLNIVVGNVYNTAFTHNFYVKKLKENEVSLKRLFENDIKGAWNTEKHKKIVKDTMAKNNILYTRYSKPKTGQLTEQTICKAADKDNYMPIKKGLDVKKYGGYDAKSVVYYILVEHTKGKKIERNIDYVYMHLKKEYEENPEKYCEEVLGLKNPKVLIKQIKINTLFSLDGFYVHLSGKTVDSLVFKPAMQLILSSDEEKYIKGIVNSIKKEQDSEGYFESNKKYIEEKWQITKEKNLEIYDKLCNKLTNTKYKIVFIKQGETLEEAREMFKEDLSLLKQCELILEILKIMHCNATTGNFTNINKAKDTGIIKKSKRAILKDYSSVKIINQSITGLFEQEIDLLGDDFTPKTRR